MQNLAWQASRKALATMGLNSGLTNGGESSVESSLPAGQRRQRSTITSRLKGNSMVGRAPPLLIPQFARSLHAGVKVLVWCGVACVASLRITVLRGTSRRSCRVEVLEVSPIGRRLDPFAKSPPAVKLSLSLTAASLRHRTKRTEKNRGLQSDAPLSSHCNPHWRDTHSPMDAQKDWSPTLGPPNWGCTKEVGRRSPV